jgi:hypothetical protein
MYIDVVNPERISPEGGVNHAAIAVPVFNWEDPDDNDARLGCKLSDHLYECLGRDRKDACKKLVRVIVTFLVYCMN